MTINELSDIIRNAPDGSKEYFGRGCLFFENKAYQECICDMLHYLSMEGDSHDALLFIAKSFAVLDPFRSLKYFESYLSKRPEDTSARMAYADALYETGNPSKSKIERDKAMGVRPDPEPKPPPNTDVKKKRSLFGLGGGR